MAEAGSMRFGNSLQPSTSDIHVDEELVKTVQKQFSGNILRTKEEGKTLKDDVLLEIEKADNLDKSEEFSESDNELCGDILQIRDDFDLIETINNDMVTFNETENKLPRLKTPEGIELTPIPVSKTLEEFIGESDVGVIWKENLQSDNGSNQKPYIPTDDIAFPDKKAENKNNCLTEVEGQINEEERMELDDSLKAVGESKTSLEPVIVSVAKSNSMSKQNNVCLSNDLFGNANDLFGIGNALVDNSDALTNNGIVSVGNASGNGNATVGIQPNDRSNTLPSLYPYKSIPQKPPDHTQYTISPELKNILQSNLRFKSEQTRRALQGERQGEGGVNERFHPYKRQSDKSKKFQTSLPILPEFE
ncbi:uncharacterized protein LOC132733792 isoform X2 [Ruditapes philippinarum]|uniref:uncharacterized protein LOC132733792 isoform X2 n=1 Tax=Ruditapes philippinarum TaxID=129788 RepID=UPI00295AD563|nr:uncharacterized protein LOC132733792 isoform X2 [Ruditapes philippinarum]